MRVIVSVAMTETRAQLSTGRESRGAPANGLRLWTQLLQRSRRSPLTDPGHVPRGTLIRAHLPPRHAVRSALLPTLTTLPNAGDVLADRYRLAAMIGLGGMGAVFRARDELVGEDVALKVLVTDDPDALHRMRAEVRLSRRVTHRNVARTFDLGRHEGSPFVTMELVEGVGLREVLQRAPRLAVVVDVLVQIALGLAAAHAAGVVHRDLKPSNVLVGPSRAVLIDFGIAIALGQRWAQVAGTAAYMAPEQLATGCVGPAADVYALGVLGVEALTGRLPGRAPAAAAEAQGTLLDLGALARLPPAVARALRGCLATGPDARLSAQTVAAELTAWRDSIDGLESSPVGASCPADARATVRSGRILESVPPLSALTPPLVSTRRVSPCSFQAAEADHHTDHGVSALRRGNVRDAVRAFGIALAMVPEHATALEQLGRVECETGRTRSGIARIERAAAFDAAAQPSLALVARSYALRGRLEEFEAILVRLHPGEGRDDAGRLALRVADWYGQVDVAQGLLLRWAASPGAADAVVLAHAALLAGVGSLDDVSRAEGEALRRARSPRERVSLLQHAAEVRARRAPDEALVCLESALSAGLVDVEWFELCPALDGLRDEVRFERVRDALHRRARALWA